MLGSALRCIRVPRPEPERGGQTARHLAVVPQRARERRQGTYTAAGATLVVLQHREMLVANRHREAQETEADE
jgi:hypothetical protein